VAIAVASAVEAEIKVEEIIAQIKSEESKEEASSFEETEVHEEAMEEKVASTEVRAALLQFISLLVYLFSNNKRPELFQSAG